MTANKKVVLSLLVTLGMIPVAAYGNAAGPPPATNAPGDGGSCARSGCHTGTAPTEGSGVEIDFPQGLTYTPGQKQRWTVRVTGAQTAGYGFQLSVRLASNETTGQAGSLASTDSRTQVICSNDSPRGSGSCPAAAPIEFINHTAPSRENNWTIEWTPPATNAGPVKVYVAGNAVNLNSTNSGDRVFLRNFTLNPQAASQAPQIRSTQPVLQAFSGQAKLSAGTWIEIYGTNLATVTREWAGSNFDGNKAPTTLEGVRVNVNGKAAFIRYVSPTQVNVQTPDDDAVGPVEVELVNAAGRSTTRIDKSKVSPALLTTPNFLVGGRQYLAALHADNVTFVGRENLIAGVPFRPAKPGDVIIVYAVGCGPTNPASPAGQFFSDARPLSLPVTFRFGQTSANVQGFLAAQAVGLCQMNVTVPNVASGDIQVEATVDNTATGQTLFTTVQQ